MSHIVRSLFSAGAEAETSAKKVSVMFESRWLFRWVGLNGVPYLLSRAYRTLHRGTGTVGELPNDGKRPRKTYQTAERR